MEKNLGQIKDEIYKAVSDLHIAFMGDDRNEFTNAQKKYDEVVSTYGKEMVQLVVDFYNENVISRAR